MVDAEAVGELGLGDLVVDDLGFMTDNVDDVLGLYDDDGLEEVFDGDDTVEVDDIVDLVCDWLVVFAVILVLVPVSPAVLLKPVSTLLETFLAAALVGLFCLLLLAPLAVLSPLPTDLLAGDFLAPEQGLCVSVEVLPIVFWFEEGSVAVISGRKDLSDCRAVSFNRWKNWRGECQ